jgi:hypothetical protein
MGVRRRTTMLRNLLCGMALAAFPLTLLAANPGAAMLYAKGSTWLNGGAVPSSSAIFPGDMVQTKSDSMADINASGSSVMVLADSLVKFEGDGVEVSHGGVNITTEKSLRTRVDNVIVTPASNGRTEFEVKNEDGTVMIMARKGDVSIDDGSGATTTLPQGQQTSRQSATKKQRRGSGAAPAAGGGILNSPIIIAAGGAGIGALVTWVALQSSTPASPKGP